MGAGMTGARHYGMDWLRIGAFALLIFYHIGMVFAPWGWVIKSPETYPVLIAPMALLMPWRLGLLFAVSGYASAHLLARSDGIRDFLATRSARLLVPLAFGMAVLVPVEMWVRVVEHGYHDTFLHFWARDYWRVGEYWHVPFPSWEHLWFLAYLWAYTAVLVGVLAMRRGSAGALVAWLGQGARLLWVPVAVLATARVVLLFLVPDEHGVLTDWAGHAEYGPLFAFGFILARYPELWAALLPLARRAAALAAACGSIVASVELSWQGDAWPPHWAIAADRAAWAGMAWSMTIALFALAQRHFNRDHPWRGGLARAIFPAYLLHHTTIVLVAWWILPLGLSAPVAFAILVAAVVAICCAAYASGRRIGPFGTLIGLPPRLEARRRSARERATA